MPFKSGPRRFLGALRDASGPPLRYTFAKINRGFDLVMTGRPTPAPIFIIGAPRSGSTILYQAMTNALDVLYIDNIAARFYFDLSLGLWLSRLMYRDRPHNNFLARRGDTAAFGGHAPNECGIFWYQWLPKDRHFVDRGTVPQRYVDQIRFAIEFPSRRFRRPLLFKNLNAGQRLRLIHEALPDARIIFISRDFEATVNSILRSRRAVGTPANEMWSILPRHHKDLTLLPEDKMCREQVRRIEAQIEEDLQLFKADQVYRLRLEDMSAATINDLQCWLGVNFRDGYMLPEFRQVSGKEIPLDASYD